MRQVHDHSLGLKKLKQRMANIKVVLVIKNPIWKENLTNLINENPDFILIYNASSKEEAIRAVEQLEIDVIIIDLMLDPPSHDGLDAIMEIRRMKRLPIIALAPPGNSEIKIEAITVGAINCINISNSKDVPNAIREAHRNQASLHPDVAGTLRREIGRLKRQELKKVLTRTEYQILFFLSLGYRQSIIMQLLGISRNTMKTHIRHIIQKFGVRTSREAAEKAKRRGLIKLQGDL